MRNGLFFESCTLPRLLLFDVWELIPGEKGEQWEAALGLLQEIVRQSLLPNVVCCSAVISACKKDDAVSCSAAVSACEKCEQWEAALGLLQDMVR